MRRSAGRIGLLLVVAMLLLACSEASVPWIEGLAFYEGEDFVELPSCTHVTRWVDRITSRPAYLRGCEVCI